MTLSLEAITSLSRSTTAEACFEPSVKTSTSSTTEPATAITLMRSSPIDAAPAILARSVATVSSLTSVGDAALIGIEYVTCKGS